MLHDYANIMALTSVGRYNNTEGGTVWGKSLTDGAPSVAEQVIYVSWPVGVTVMECKAVGSID